MWSRSDRYGSLCWIRAGVRNWQLGNAQNTLVTALASLTSVAPS